MNGMPDETGAKLISVMDKSSELEKTWKTYDFVEIAKDVFKLRRACDDYLEWAEKEVKDDKGS